MKKIADFRGLLDIGSIEVPLFVLTRKSTANSKTTFVYSEIKDSRGAT